MRQPDAPVAHHETHEVGRARVLVADDDADLCQLLRGILVRAGHDVVTCLTAQEALDRMADSPFDVVLTDWQMAHMDGIELCERVVKEHRGVPVLLMTAHGDRDLVISAIRAGAYDFISKPVEEQLLVPLVARAARARMLDKEVTRLRREVSTVTPIPGIVGTSPAMRRVFDLIMRVSQSDASVLLEGETGTGKELIARAIHARSARAAGPFVALNCAAVPATLLESELFGHARGAFTDAKAPRVGMFVEANGGTLFLDEIGDMPSEIQPKLLRALQERKVRPLGANVEESFDARIITATHRDLEADVAGHRFREDLYYRVNVVTIHVPPLRERGTDVLAMAQHFLRARSDAQRTLSAPVAELLMSYDWPGNARELENCMERALALSRFDQITTDDLPEKVRAHRAERVVIAAEDPSELVAIHELEARYIRRVLKIVGGNKARAARVLGLDRRTLYRKLERLNGAATTDDSHTEQVAHAEESS